MRLGILFLVWLSVWLSFRASARAADLVSVQLTRDTALERGRATPLSLGVVLASGLRLLDDAPLVLELEGSALQPLRRVFYRRDAVDPHADAPRFEVEVRVDRTGAPALLAHLTAWVCRGRRCRPVEVTNAVPLAIAEPRRPEHVP
jgi:hypothetical protein